MMFHLVSSRPSDVRKSRAFLFLFACFSFVSFVSFLVCVCLSVRGELEKHFKGRSNVQHPLLPLYYYVLVRSIHVNAPVVSLTQHGAALIKGLM